MGKCRWILIHMLYRSGDSKNKTKDPIKMTSEISSNNRVRWKENF